MDCPGPDSLPDSLSRTPCGTIFTEIKVSSFFILSIPLLLLIQRLQYLQERMKSLSTGNRLNKLEYYENAIKALQTTPSALTVCQGNCDTDCNDIENGIARIQYLMFCYSDCPTTTIPT